LFDFGGPGFFVAEALAVGAFPGLGIFAGAVFAVSAARQASMAWMRRSRSMLAEVR
jgi:hypothetical protein